MQKDQELSLEPQPNASTAGLFTVLVPTPACSWQELCSLPGTASPTWPLSRWETGNSPGHHPLHPHHHYRKRAWHAVPGHCSEDNCQHQPAVAVRVPLPSQPQCFSWVQKLTPGTCLEARRCTKLPLTSQAGAFGLRGAHVQGASGPQP